MVFINAYLFFLHKNALLAQTEIMNMAMRKGEACVRGREQVKKGADYGISRYFLLTILLSFLGWSFEVLVMFVQTGRFYNQGFMTLPFCPIYGCSLMVTYFLLGTPNAPKGILKRVKGKKGVGALYLIFAFCIPTIAELLVGAVFDRGLNLMLWSYENMPMNFQGYVSLPISLAWSGLIFIFMRYVFAPIKRAVGKIPNGILEAISFSLVFILLIDFSLNLAVLLYR